MYIVKAKVNPISFSISHKAKLQFTENLRRRSLLDKTFYEMIFKRKSFHIFRNVGNESIGEAELDDIQNAYTAFIPLNPETSERFGSE